MEIISTLRDKHDNDLIFRFDPESYPSLNHEAQSLEELFPEIDFNPDPTTFFQHIGIDNKEEVKIS